MEIILKNKQDIEGSNWIEFNISGTYDKYENWAEDSKYLDEESYESFYDIFEKHSPDFDYYGATSFNTLQLKNIKHDIATKSSEAAKERNFQDITTLLDFCIKHNRTLWILGL